MKDNHFNEETNWDHYLGGADKAQYSTLDQINLSNVSELKVAWKYSSEDADVNDRSQIQCNPLVIDGILYGTSAKLKLFAVDAQKGTELWTFDPFSGAFDQFGMGTNRGLAMYSSNQGRRIFYSAGDRLYAVNPDNGSLISTFGESGSISLHKGLGEASADYFITSNTPGIVFKDLIIMGSRVSESTRAAPGHIRAFDVLSGEMKWIFHTIPLKDQEGADTWPEGASDRIGGANVWAGFSIDHERGILYCPTGSAAYDFYGGDRAGDNLYANCIIAVDANTGKKLWHYQTVHHDMWDKDLPIAPNLVTIKKDGKNIDALVQATKSGYLFVLNRETGAPLYPINELSVKASDLEGEVSSSIQPIPTVYPSFSRQTIMEDDLADRNEEASAFAKFIFETTRHDGMFEPPSEEGTIIFPGFDGGGEWGGGAYDKVENNLIINSNEVPWLCTMDAVVPSGRGEGLYKSQCQSCHGDQFQGGQLFGNVPSLVNLKSKMTRLEVLKVVENGKGVMPGFAHLGKDKVDAIYDFITGQEDPNDKIKDDSWPYPYRMRGYKKLYAPDGYPIIKPPWGQLTSINLDKAEINWQVPLGSYKELENVGLSITGTENYGGPVVTAGGLVFIAATADEKIRAYDKSTGEEVWQHELPAAGYATPAVYSVDGKQYIVIACGGGKLNTKSGDEYIAFTLSSQ